MRRWWGWGVGVWCGAFFVPASEIGEKNIEQVIFCYDGYLVEDVRHFQYCSCRDRECEY